MNIINYYRILILRVYILYRFKIYLQKIILKNKKNEKKINENIRINFIICQYNGWILEGIINEIIKYLPKNYSYVKSYELKDLEDADLYFFVHYQLYHSFLAFGNKYLNPKKCLIWFTHPNNSVNFSHKSLIYSLNRAGIIFSTCTIWKNKLMEHRINENKIVVPIGGADENIFLKSTQNSRTVIISSAFYERKNPVIIHELIEQSKDINFILLGKNWEKYTSFNQLISCQNLRYLDVPYSEYPQYYAQASIYLSLSNLEGGPIPLIEAMMSNLIPVVTNTGFAKDVIKDGKNGLIIELSDLNINLIKNKIEKAFNMEFDNRTYTLNNYSWSAFSKVIFSSIEKLLK
jgi:glycosyltransferase involved in cell wall biosynthesis